MSNKQAIPAEEIVELTKAALEDVKAQDILVIDVRDKNSITDFMVIATGTSNRQISAMREKVRELSRAVPPALRTIPLATRLLTTKSSLGHASASDRGGFAHAQVGGRRLA
ncbi:MAG: ribosome silencing factor [Oxalobacteraceae bacterium]|nr:MAG: ribosome silencing factor [Oxalobacteraceae bacterium]